MKSHPTRQFLTQIGLFFALWRGIIYAVCALANSIRKSFDGNSSILEQLLRLEKENKHLVERNNRLRSCSLHRTRLSAVPLLRQKRSPAAATLLTDRIRKKHR